MPRYRNEHGVVVNVPEETARLVGGLTPIDQPTPTTPAPDPDALSARLTAEQAYHADVTAWLAAEQAYHADVTAWLSAEIAAGLRAASDEQSVGARRGRK